MECHIVYGYYWELCEELDSIGERVINYLIENGILKGSVMAECASSEFNIPIIKRDNEPIDNIEFKILKIDTEELKVLKEKYLLLLNNKLNFDNLIFVVEDYPFYSNSNRSYESSSILVITPDNEFFIDVAYKKKRYNFNENDYNILKDKVRRFTLYNKHK